MRNYESSERKTQSFENYIESILEEENVSEREEGLANMGLSLLTDRCPALNNDPTWMKRYFEKDSSYESYLLPGVGGNPSYQEVSQVYSSHRVNQNSGITEVGKYHISEVPQTFLYNFPIEESPLLYLGLTECSALVAKTDKRIFVAHIGLSEIGEIKGAIKFFKENNIDASQIVAHASLGDVSFSSSDTSQDFDHRHANMDTYLSLGLSPENIYPFEYKYEEKEGSKMHEKSRGIVVGKDFHVAFSFDFEEKGFTYISTENLRDITSINS